MNKVDLRTGLLKNKTEDVLKYQLKMKAKDIK